MRLKETDQGTHKKKKTKSVKKLSLTPEIQALYFQCLAGNLHSFSHEVQRLIVQILPPQFPIFQKETRRFVEKLQLTVQQPVFNFVLKVMSSVIKAARKQAETLIHRARQEGNEADPHH